MTKTIYIMETQQTDSNSRNNANGTVTLY